MKLKALALAGLLLTPLAHANSDIMVHDAYAHYLFTFNSEQRGIHDSDEPQR